MALWKVVAIVKDKTYEDSTPDRRAAQGARYLDAVNDFITKMKAMMSKSVPSWQYLTEATEVMPELIKQWG